MERELTNIELMGKQKWLVEPYLLKNSSDLMVENFAEVCQNNIEQLKNKLEVCNSLSYENKRTKPALKQQINSAIEQLTAAYTQPQSVQELTKIVDDLLNDIDLLLKDKKVLEFLLKTNVSNSSSIENQLVEQGKTIQAKQKFASTFVKAKISLFNYSEEEQKQIKSKLSSMDKKVKKVMEEYQVYLDKQAEKVETETASV